jgi:hypothetical protein
MVGASKQSRCCQDGDITVTQVPSGYLVGRVLPKLGPGPWWEYVALISGFPEATGHAVALARASGARAWLYKGDNAYEALEE